MTLTAEPIDSRPDAAALIDSSSAALPDIRPSKQDAELAPCPSADDDLPQQSMEDLRAVANAIPQLTWIAEHDGKRVWHNERWYAYTGTTPEQMQGEGWKR